MVRPVRESMGFAVFRVKEISEWCLYLSITISLRSTTRDVNA